MSDHDIFEELHDLNEDGEKQPQSKMMPVSVVITTHDYEITGIVFVSREVRNERRLSELLNSPTRRFLAITDVHLKPVNKPGTSRHYKFLQIRLDSIMMLHPSTQAIFDHGAYSSDEAMRLDKFREKLTKKVV